MPQLNAFTPPVLPGVGQRVNRRQSACHYAPGTTFFPAATPNAYNFVQGPPSPPVPIQCPTSTPTEPDLSRMPIQGGRHAFTPRRGVWGVSPPPQLPRTWTASMMPMSILPIPNQSTTPIQPTPRRSSPLSNSLDGGFVVAGGPTITLHVIKLERNAAIILEHRITANGIICFNLSHVGDPHIIKTSGSPILKLRETRTLSRYYYMALTEFASHVERRGFKRKTVTITNLQVRLGKPADLLQDTRPLPPIQQKIIDKTVHLQTTSLPTSFTISLDPNT
ncbi:hypothetical protein B0H10DRAFT_1957578 [Mycena sp. CBHHK59/15]|nr:hypothetical protein B0H10DRAFT_1957578 [Mycena sp. CBHHK59/15]